MFSALGTSLVHPETRLPGCRGFPNGLCSVRGTSRKMVLTSGTNGTFGGPEIAVVHSKDLQNVLKAVMLKGGVYYS